MMYTIEGLISERDKLRTIIVKMMGQADADDFSEELLKEIKEALECKQ